MPEPSPHTREYSELLSLKGIQAGYRDRRAPVLQDVSLTVQSGEMVALVGPNGSGKSTLLRVASGVHVPWHGRVTLLGREMASLSPSERARAVAVVAQSPTVPESFTALELVLWGRTPHLRFLSHEGSHDLAVARRAMEATETWAYAHRRAGEVSGGERQRLAIARALAQETPLLLLDEPTAHLDLRHQSGLFDLVRALLENNALKGVLVAVHDLTLAARYVHRIVLLDRGAVAADGLPGEVLTAERIGRVYGTAVAVVPHPVTGTPAILPVGDLRGPQHLEGFSTRRAP